MRKFWREFFFKVNLLENFFNVNLFQGKKFFYKEFVAIIFLPPMGNIFSMLGVIFWREKILTVYSLSLVFQRTPKGSSELENIFILSTLL